MHMIHSSLKIAMLVASRPCNQSHSLYYVGCTFVASPLNHFWWFWCYGALEIVRAIIIIIGSSCRDTKQSFIEFFLHIFQVLCCHLCNLAAHTSASHLAFGWHCTL